MESKSQTIYTHNIGIYTCMHPKYLHKYLKVSKKALTVSIMY
jgi:hypothetical protein